MNSLITYLKYNVQTRNHFEKKSRDQVEDIYQIHRLRGIPCVKHNFIPCQEVEQKKVTSFFHVKLGQQIMSSIEKMQFDHAQIFYISDLWLKKCFL